MEPPNGGANQPVKRSLQYLAILLATTLLPLPLAAAAPIIVTGQLLDVEQGFIFFTTGDAFRAAPHLIVRSARTGKPTQLIPAPRIYARATFAADGSITELDLSRTPLPAEGSFAEVARFAIALSSPQPNPDLAPPTPNAHGFVARYTGKHVLVIFTVQVPPQTPQNANIYITTDASGWNPQAIRLDRIDALHYRVVRTVISGTELRYLYTRGSLSTEEVGRTGISRKPRLLDVTDADVHSVSSVVAGWADQGPAGKAVIPQTMPTPYNPSPFSNLPSPPP